MPVPPPTSRTEPPEAPEAPEPRRRRLALFFRRQGIDLTVVAICVGAIAGLSTLRNSEAARTTFVRHHPWMNIWGGGHATGEPGAIAMASHRKSGSTTAMDADLPDDCYECSDEVAQSRYDCGDGTVNGINIEGFQDFALPDRLDAAWAYRHLPAAPEFYDKGGRYGGSADLSVADNLSDPLADAGGNPGGRWHPGLDPTGGTAGTPPLRVDPGHHDVLVTSPIPEPCAFVLTLCGVGAITLGARSRRARRAY